MNRPIPFPVTALITALALQACTTIDTREAVEQTEQRAEEVRENHSRGSQPAHIPRTAMVDTPWLGAGEAVETPKHEWLDSITGIDLHPDEPLNAREVMRMLRDEGVPISTSTALPLDRYTYAGFGLDDVNARTALRSIVSAMGLDYKVDDEARVVQIVPMQRRTWYLNVQNRKAEQTQHGSNADTLAETDDASDDEQTDNTTDQNQDSYTVTVTDNIFPDLKEELESRLTIQVPRASDRTVNSMMANRMLGYDQRVRQGDPNDPSGNAPPIPPGGARSGQQRPTGPTGGQDSSFFQERTIGHVSVNPSSGAVTVQAPRWMLQDLAPYMDRVARAYNAKIIFRAQYTMLSTNQGRSEGIDASMFARFAERRWGAIFSNNALGGVTVSFPDASSNIPSVTAESGAGTLAGIRSPADGFQAFNAYLRQFGSLSVIDRPVITTVTGRPSEWKRSHTFYIQDIEQDAAPGTDGTAGVVATDTDYRPINTGLQVWVNPRLDVETGLVRSQVLIIQKNQVGTQKFAQPVSSGEGIVQFEVERPRITSLKYDGEVLLKEGELVVLGGQIIDRDESSSSGMPGHSDDSPYSGALGTKEQNKERATYYFALQVDIQKEAS